ncbi:TatD family hydrolase [Mizugakiibacter sediminis]|uniref:DNAase n=1 Tax=Mizugakiibacter sediminis TaxID=1475481 RepID=A0A0S6YZ42_9GAMM|nr:TatD family hydrolase [Mizugakiibacter sediminis]
MRITDSHAHLDAREFDADRAAVLERARAAGVAHQIVPAVNAAGWAPLRALCANHPDLHPAYGLHPMYLADHAPQHLHELGDWLQRERAVAVGECGLDFYVEGLDAELQRMYFVRQLELAREFALPVIVHARRALDEVIAALRRIGGLRGVVHSFSGSEEQARQLWKLGFGIGIGGPVTYPRAQRLRRIVAAMPLQYLLLETDAPDQPGIGHRGERNEPAHLVEVLDCIAALRGMEREALAAATSGNAAALFGLA